MRTVPRGADAAEHARRQQPGADAPVVLGVNLDGDAGRAASVAQSLGLTFPDACRLRSQSVGRLYDVEKLPLTLLVDRDGIVRGAVGRRRGPAVRTRRVRSRRSADESYNFRQEWLPAACAGLLATHARRSPADALVAGRDPAPPRRSGSMAAAARGVDQDVQDLKKQLVDLNRDLFKLEEEILYPASTQVAVFLSVDVGTFFALDSVTLKVDDKEVANYLYTEREVQALHRGGVQKLYLGNLKAGKHELVAFFTGKGPHDRDYRRGASCQFDKTVGRQVRRTAHQRPRGVAAAGVRRPAVGVGGPAAGCSGAA